MKYLIFSGDTPLYIASDFADAIALLKTDKFKYLANVKICSLNSPLSVNYVDGKVFIN